MSKLILKEGAAPSTPSSTYASLYLKADKKLYFKNDAGTELEISTGSSSGDLQSDGTVALTANWDVGAFKITALQLESDIVTGTAPLIVASTTVVTNLNADLLDGNEASAFATAAQGTLADSAIQQAALDAAVAGLYDHKGAYNASTNSPDLDTAPSGIKKADAYTVSVAGTFYAVTVEAGDVLIADQDNPTLSSHWTIVNRNIDSTAFATAAQGATADAAAVSGGAEHDGFSDFVANEHTDWGGTTRNFSTSGTLNCGAFTSIGIDDNATSVAMTIDASGNVGIGTTSPAQALHVKGSSAAIAAQVTADTQTARFYFLNTAGTNVGRIQYDITAAEMSFIVGSVEHAKLGATNLDLSGINLKVDSGKGIDYTANGGTVLSQHKVGTFTGTLSGAGAGGTPQNATGYYEKTGNKMHAEIYFANMNTTGMTGELQITGMPEAAAHQAVGSAWLHVVASPTVGQNPVIGVGTTKVTLQLNGTTAVQNVSAGTGRYFKLSIDYLV